MPKTTPSKDDTLFRLFNEIGIIAQLSANAFERVLPHELTLAQFTLLNHCVRLGDGWAPARLAAAFQVTRGTMTNTLQKLEAKGFIRLEADASDARAKRVFLTAAGQKARAESLKALGPQMQRLAKALDQKDVLAALPLLKSLRVWLDTHRAG